MLAVKIGKVIELHLNFDNNISKNYHNFANLIDSVSLKLEKYPHKEIQNNHSVFTGTTKINTFVFLVILTRKESPIVLL